MSVAVAEAPAVEAELVEDSSGPKQVRRRIVVWAGAVAGLLLVVALVAVAGFPAGEPSPADLVASDARLAARAPIEDVHVLLTVSGGELVTIVAYEDDKGWLGVDLEPVARETPAAWAATSGEGPVPALSTVYGIAPGERVRVDWSDGETTRIDTERDGAYVVARPERVEVDRVVVRDGGETVLEVTEL